MVWTSKCVSLSYQLGNKSGNSPKCLGPNDFYSQTMKSIFVVLWGLTFCDSQGEMVQNRSMTTLMDDSKAE